MTSVIEISVEYFNILIREHSSTMLSENLVKKCIFNIWLLTLNLRYLAKCVNGKVNKLQHKSTLLLCNFCYSFQCTHWIPKNLKLTQKILLLQPNSPSQKRSNLQHAYQPVKCCYCFVFPVRLPSGLNSISTSRYQVFVATRDEI